MAKFMPCLYYTENTNTFFYLRGNHGTLTISYDSSFVLSKPIDVVEQKIVEVYTSIDILNAHLLSRFPNKSRLCYALIFSPLHAFLILLI